MGFTKFVYNVIGWLNKSESMTTPLGKLNLRHMDDGIKTIGDNLNAAYDELDAGKLDKETAYTMVSDVAFDEKTGIFTVTRLNGANITIDTKLEKIATNWTFDKDSQKLILTLDDGTKQEVDLSALITQYEFLDTDTIAFTIGSDGKVSANVKDGSVTEEKLQPNYLADIKTQAANAVASASQAADSADAAEYDAKLAQSYAIGGSGVREGEDEDNAKTSKEEAQKAAEEAKKALETMQDAQVTGVKGSAESEYRRGNVEITPESIGLEKVPNVETNDQTPTFTVASTRANIVSGEKLSTIFGKIMKFFADLKTVAFTGSYSDLNGKPNYAGSSSEGGAANSADKINTNAGSAAVPVYFGDGIPKACTTSATYTSTGTALFTRAGAYNLYNALYNKVFAYVGGAVKTSASHTLNTSYGYLMLGIGQATAVTGGASDIICGEYIYYDGSAWKRMQIFNYSFPAISISGNTLTITYKSGSNVMSVDRYILFRLK